MNKKIDTANALLTLNAVALTSVVALAGAGPNTTQQLLLTGFLGALNFGTGVMGNQTHTWLTGEADKRKPLPEEIFRNHHIRRLVEESIATVLREAEPKHNPFQKNSYKKAVAEFPAFIGAAVEDPNGPLAVLGDFHLPDLLTEFAKHEGKVTLLTPEIWRELLEENTSLSASFGGAFLTNIGKALHERLGEALWGYVKRANEKDPQAFAAVELLYLSRILAAVEGKPGAPDTTELENHVKSLFDGLETKQQQWFTDLRLLAEKHHVADLAQHAETQRKQDATHAVVEEMRTDLKTALAAPRSVSRIFNLRTPHHLFGRESDVEQLVEAIRQRNVGGVAISGVHGMGGVGKTELALTVAHELKNDYPDAWITLDLRGFDAGGRPPMPPQEILSDVITAFHPEAKLPESLEDLQAIYRTVLHQAGKVLLFFDNAFDAAQVEACVPPPHCLLLITSRNHFTVSGLDMVSRDVNCLPPEKSQEMLLSRAPRLDGLEARAAVLCGHLPITLRTFADAVAQQKIVPVGELVERLAAHAADLSPQNRAFQVSYDVLPAPLQSRWLMLAVFPNDFDLPAVMAIWQETSRETATRNVQTLLDFSLVEFYEKTGRFRLHDLVRQFCLEKLDAEATYAAQKRHATHYEGVLRAADDLYLEGNDAVVRGLKLFDTERTNIEAGQAWAAAHATRDAEAAHLCMMYPDAGVYVLDLRQHPHEQIAWLEAQATAARKLKRRDAEGTALGNLGLAYYSLGETRRAIEYCEKALIVSREIGDRRGEGNDLMNLGNAYYLLGEARQAIEYHEQALPAFREIGDRRGEGNALGSLGNAYAALGETRRAIEYCEQYLAIAREIGDRRGEGNALYNWADELIKLGERARAVELAAAALTIFEAIEDPNAAQVRAVLEEWRAS